MRTIDPNLIVAFVHVAEQRSFREAARKLGIPKSTMSQRVATLEARLGVRLLARTTRSLALTDIGSSYLHEVAPAVTALIQAETVVSKLQAHPSGRLRMTAPYAFGQNFFGDLMARYSTAYADVRLDVDLTDRRVDLVEEGYDLAVRVGPLADSRLVARKIGRPQRIGFFASRSYLQRFGRPKVPRDLATHRCLTMSGAFSPNTWLLKPPHKPVEIRPHIAVNSFSVLSELAAQGLGIARLPTFEIKHTLVEVLRDYAPSPTVFFSVYPSARFVSPAVRAMVDMLSELPF